MSAYMVDNSTISRIVSAFEKYHKGSGQNPTIHCPELLQGLDPQKMGEALYRMNERAIIARYGEESVKEFAEGRPGGSGFVFQRDNLSNMMQDLKSIRCLIYQCSEGEVFKEELYKQIDAYSGDLALAIVSRLPQYESARWA